MRLVNLMSFVSHFLCFDRKHGFRNESIALGAYKSGVVPKRHRIYHSKGFLLGRSVACCEIDLLTTRSNRKSIITSIFSVARLLAPLITILTLAAQANAGIIAKFGYDGNTMSTGWAMDPNISTVSAIDYGTLSVHPLAPTGINGNNYFGFAGDGDSTGKYVTISVNPNDGYKVNYSGFSISFHDPATTGTGSIFLRSSADGYAMNYLSNNTYSGVANGNHIMSFDLSSISALQNLSGETFFRIYFDPIGDGNMIRIQNLDPIKSIYDEPFFSTHAISLSGVVGTAPVPEPTSMAIFGLGALGMAYRARCKARAKAEQA